jgi:REP element-mobilizing transposase RayT
MLRAVGGRGRPPHTMSSGASPLAKYRYRRRLPHLQKADADIFVTFCTGGPLVLSSAARDLVLEHCLREDVSNLARAPSPANCWQPRIKLWAAVIMPDHVHLLLSPLRDGSGWPFPLVDILQCLKSATAHRINKFLHHSGPVWEEESFDHVLRSDESLEEKCEYIRQNPVKAGLVRRAEDYPWLWVNPEFGNRPRGDSDKKSKAAGEGARSTFTQERERPV